jgi:ubiquinone/menaquinone biosynthesis C-methylase UbiE
MSNYTPNELEEIASQLRKPEGEMGKEVGLMMNDSNEGMIKNSIDSLHLKNNDRILELGHGNGKHINLIIDKGDNINYFGLDISPLMSEEARQYCQENGFSTQTEFLTYDGIKMPYPDQSFDKILTVNTLYFCDQPEEMFKEIRRVLKPNGTATITFVDEETMKQQAFTEFGFTKYNKEKFELLCNNNHFDIVELTPITEQIKSHLFQDISRKYWIASVNPIKRS